LLRTQAVHSAPVSPLTTRTATLKIRAKIGLTLVSAVLICVSINTGLGAEAPPIYTSVDLGDLGGGDSVANAINNSGRVVGYSFTGRKDPFTQNPIDDAFLYSSGIMTDLSILLPVPVN
jgi:probable HAF family extracellular repeat protein